MENAEESEQKKYKLRNRSRSRSETPLIFGRSVIEGNDSERQYDLRSRSRERSMTPGDVSSSRRSSSRTIPSNVAKIRNKNMDTITEHNFDILEEAISNIQNDYIEAELFQSTAKKSERRSERQKIKKQVTVNGQIGSKAYTNSQKSENQEKSKVVTAVQKNLTSDYSSEEGDKEEGLSRSNSAYEFYKQQGDYWNKFPKTDYTYSLASTCRYEVAPGVMAIPNMSRRSLHSDTSFYGSQTSDSQSSKESFSEENNTMNANNFRKNLMNAVPQVLPHVRGSENDSQEIIYRRSHTQNHTTRRTYELDSNDSHPIHERYEKWADPLLKSHPLSRYRSAGNLDSDSDFDEAVTKLRHRHKSRSSWKFTQFSTLISTWFYAMLYFITFGQYGRQSSATSHYYRRYEDTRWRRIQRRIDTILQYVYLFLIKVALLDTWILSSASSIRSRFQGRHKKIFWIILLPFLLTSALCVLPYASSIIPSVPNLNVAWFESGTSFPQKSTQNDAQYNQELKDTIDLLLHRIQRLEIQQTEKNEKLTNVSRIVEELSHPSSQIWRLYNDRLGSLEQLLENQNTHKNECTERSEELNTMRAEFETIKNLVSQLKTCCDESSNSANDEKIRKQAEDVVTGYFGDAVSRDDVIKMFQIINSKIHLEEIQKMNPNSAQNSELGVEDIRKIVLGILKIYDADKTGQVDYALESAGGQVISTRCTQLYDIKTRAFKIFGMTLFYESNNPRTVIQGNILQPGMCWAFQDFPGYLLVKLRSLIHVTGFTVEHASRLNLPNGEMKSAPKKFNVWGLQSENDAEPVLFGEYEFLDSDESIQYFPVQNTSITSPYEYVEMRIHSNHGQLEYTCLYRFRVHGNLA
ncbi:hypothetical protein QAD02_019274 [Eretmocerus hayati]|uniref:Uncharacterized protein n=1 Tax=Eretmocerus hayati TaxID=131215 RepID=A0ACC2PJE6_9HYME|nr:hypothetical protein QAD02_019274 [Eretmocerus hayati]